MAGKIIVAGGTGFLGSALARRWRDAGWEVVILTRRKPKVRGDGVREVHWNAMRLGAWARELEGAHAVVNFTGAPIDCVHNEVNRRLILETRVRAVRALGEAMRACAQPPTVWVQSSATGYYGHQECERSDEGAAPGDTFLAQVCRQWEQVFAEACPAQVRGVVLRIGVVLGRRGGAYPALADLVRYFLGGRAGSGRQGVSWILQDDIEAIIQRAVEDESMRGAYNACSPHPVSNAVFMAALRDSLKRPWAPPAPAWVIRLLAPWVVRTDPSLALQGNYAVPQRLLEEGFSFQSKRLDQALARLA